MIIPLRTDSRLHGTPWVNLALIVVNVAVFVAQAKRPEFFVRFVLFPHDTSLFSFVSYAFLHGDVWHLVGNMLFLYIFGNNVNDKMGNAGYLAFYLAGGVLAGVGHVLTQNSAVLGASGAVSAVTGAYLALFPRSNVTVFYWFILIGWFEISSLWFIGFYFAKDLFMSLAQLGGERWALGVAYTAHLSGAVFGLGLCLALLAARLLPRDQFDVLALLDRWRRRRQYQELVQKGYDPFGYITPKNAAKPTPMQERVQELRASVNEALAHHQPQRGAELYLQLRQLDPQQVLSRQNQLDVANQLASQELHTHAAEAYELFIKTYPNYDQVEQVQLILGLIYARYLRQPGKAREHLEKALPRLHDQRQQDLARGELEQMSKV